MRIRHQGEPVGFALNKVEWVEEEGRKVKHYVPSFDDYEFEALVKDSSNHIIKSWKTSDGSIEKGQEIIDGETAALASFNLSGSDTSSMSPGIYSVELARVIDGARAIGIADDVLLIKEALIREGV